MELDTKSQRHGLAERAVQVVSEKTREISNYVWQGHYSHIPKHLMRRVTPAELDARKTNKDAS